MGSDGKGAVGAGRSAAGAGHSAVDAGRSAVGAGRGAVDAGRGVADAGRFGQVVDGGLRLCDDGFLDTLTAKEIGTLGESLAASYLEQRGYEIIERNYRCSEGEADLIALDEDGGEVVLVEVKTRRVRAADGEVYPEEAVTKRKERRYKRIAFCYAMEHFPTPSIRFDVIAVSLCSGCIAGIEHLYRAFDWDADR